MSIQGLTLISLSLKTYVGVLNLAWSAAAARLRNDKTPLLMMDG
jgi:hypothetical protein